MLDNKLLDNLLKALQYENRTYNEILGIAARKADALVLNDTKALSSVTEQETAMAEQTFKLNQIREQLLAKICEALGESLESFTLETLLNYLNGPYKKQFQDIRTKLSDTVNKLKIRNNTNQKLIENAIRVINFNIELIASPQPAVPLYGRSGQEVSHSTKRSVLDVKY